MKPTNEQLELTLAAKQEAMAAPKITERRNRAEWWFRQMRQVVDKALDWEPAPGFRPQQILLPNTTRQF